MNAWRGLVACSMILVLALATASPAHAQRADVWIVEDLSGAVVRLAGDRWLEVADGEKLGVSTALRVLPGSRAELRAGGLALNLGPDTAVTALSGPKGRSVDQYSGTLDILYASDATGDLIIHTPGMVVSSSGGALSVSVDGDVTQVAVLSGAAKATNTVTGRFVVLLEGQSVSDPDGQLIAAGDPAVGASLVAASDSSASNPNSNAGGNPNSNAGGNPNSNAGGNPNSNAGGNPNSNAGGNPNSNAGGNPNSNAGGNPNSSAGGNPNANAGGNPNANAGGNPNANAGGNPNANAGGNPNANAGGNPNSNAGGAANGQSNGNNKSKGGESAGTGGTSQ